MLLVRGAWISARASRTRVAATVAALFGSAIAGGLAPRWIAFAQATPRFEVASVKPEPWTGQGGIFIMVRGNTLTAEHIDLCGLVEFAYGLRNIQLSGGPAWARHGVLDASVLYQVIAKAAGDPPPPTDQFRLMLQGLLADRFKLKVHHINKDLPVYNLVVAKSGLKLKESAADAKFSMGTRSRTAKQPDHGHARSDGDNGRGDHRKLRRPARVRQDWPDGNLTISSSNGFREAFPARGPMPRPPIQTVRLFSRRFRTNSG